MAGKQKQYREGMVVGTNFYEGDADAMRRQERAMDALVALTDVVAVDLQWTARPPARPSLRVVAALAQDSTMVTGAAGRRKPIASDVFDALAAIADAEGCSRFLFFNSDIVLTQAAVDLARQPDLDGCAFSRLDEDRGGRAAGILLSGIDAFAVDVAWWRANRRRFRPYILGESCWDNVYAAILMAHGRSVIENRDGLVRHEAHAAAWSTGPFAEHNGILAAFDARYFTRWVAYHDRLVTARARGAGAEEERAIAREAFAWKRSPRQAIRQAGRTLRARLQYERRQRAWRAQANTRI